MVFRFSVLRVQCLHLCVESRKQDWWNEFDSTGSRSQKAWNCDRDCTLLSNQWWATVITTRPADYDPQKVGVRLVGRRITGKLRLIRERLQFPVLEPFAWICRQKVVSGNWVGFQRRTLKCWAAQVVVAELHRYLPKWKMKCRDCHLPLPPRQKSMPLSKSIMARLQVHHQWLILTNDGLSYVIFFVDFRSSSCTFPVHCTKRRWAELPSRRCSHNNRSRWSSLVARPTKGPGIAHQIVK